MDIAAPYLLFLGRAATIEDAKTASGIAHWRPDACLGQLRLPGCRVDLGLPDLDPQAAAAAGARTLVVGLAPLGGAFEADWVALFEVALTAGLDLASGLHARLADVPELARTAARLGRRILDVRAAGRAFPTATYRKRRGLRLLTVGTDCAVGKKYTALAIHRELRLRGVDADFRATGQTEIIIAGGGVAVDAVVADFLSGAAESLSPDAPPDHWDVIEGQGSLFHPAYAGVSLGLLHGSQPDAIVLCHDARRAANGDFPDLPLPELADCAELNLRHARLVNPAARLAGASLNTSGMSEAAARAALAGAERRLAVPAVDPVRFGVARIVDTLARAREPASG